MSYSPGEEAEELRGVVRGFLTPGSSAGEVMRTAATEPGYDPKVWSQAAGELGLPGLAVPERFDGAGATPVELGIVFEEMGAVLYTGPFFSTVGLAASLLAELGDEDAAAAYLPRIVSGAITATVAWAGSDPAHTTLTARRVEGTWRLEGTAPIVVDGADADLVLVAARTPDGTGVFEVAGIDGLVRTPLTSLDSTRRLAQLQFAGTLARRRGGEGDAMAALERTSHLASLYLAAEQLGGAAKVLATATEYAKTRVQFGRPIGSFQAVKHRLADMLVDVESARSVVHHGLWTAVHDRANLPTAAALARSLASDAYQRVAADNIQVHGGIGFTWEHSAHLYLKRAKSSQLLLGAPRLHRARLAELLDLAGRAGAATREPADVALDSAPEHPASSEEAALHKAVDEFLAQHPVPPAANLAADRAFREARFDAGLAVVSLSTGLGGRGLDPSLQTVVEHRFSHAGAIDHTASNVIGLGMALPTIAAHGTPEQHARFLRRCFSGEHIWCQLFSEPGAGSDLAGLATRAVRDGDGTEADFIVDGQKIWTSLGHVADFAILIARTDPQVPKHKGLTYFVLDMKSPGVEVRPLRQLTGEAEFNEVFLTGVRVPATNVLGEVGQGWRVAMTTLANERVSLGGRVAERGSGPIGQAIDTYRAGIAEGRIDPSDTAVVERLMLLWTRVEAARLSNLRAASQIGRQPGPEGSIAKLQMAELNKAVYELCVDLSGDAGLLIDDYAETVPTSTAVHGGGDIRKAYLRSLANSIEGGTSEVLRNILGERVLGLPGEPVLDRDQAWKDLKHS